MTKKIRVNNFIRIYTVFFVINSHPEHFLVKNFLLNYRIQDTVWYDQDNYQVDKVQKKSFNLWKMIKKVIKTI